MAYRCFTPNPLAGGGHTAHGAAFLLHKNPRSHYGRTSPVALWSPACAVVPPSRGRVLHTMRTGYLEGGHPALNCEKHERTYRTQHYRALYCTAPPRMILLQSFHGAGRPSRDSGGLLPGAVPKAPARFTPPKYASYPRHFASAPPAPHGIVLCMPSVQGLSFLPSQRRRRWSSRGGISPGGRLPRRDQAVLRGESAPPATSLPPGYGQGRELPSLPFAIRPCLPLTHPHARS